MEQTELRHHGVLGMKWGVHQSGLQKVATKYHKKASVQYSKYMLSATKAHNRSAKLINPLYYHDERKAAKQWNKYVKYDGISKSAQKQFELGDPIGKFMKECDSYVNKGLNWVAKNPEVAASTVEALSKKLMG